jgi:ABC-2 type transport system permease protein
MSIVRGLRRVLALARAEVLHVVRDRAMTVQIVVMPIVQLLVLANAATFQIRDVPTYVVDYDRTTVSRGLIDAFTAGGLFHIVGTAPSAALANDALLRGRATMVLTIPNDFESSIVRTRVGRVQLELNAEKGSSVGIVQSYAGQILAAYSARLSIEVRPTTQLARAAPTQATPVRGAARIEIRAQGWYNATLNYKHYMVPGILVALMTMIGTLLTAQNIAREKEVGTLEQLNVTPITRGQFIAAKLLPFLALALINLTLGLIVARLVFAVPMRGSIMLLYGAAAVYLVVALGIGLWVSTIVETQQQAMFVTFFILMVYLLMSGLFTPVDSMPEWVRALSQLNPVRHFVTIARAILMKGAGPSEIARPMLILAAYGVAVLTLAVRQHTKRSA